MSRMSASKLSDIQARAAFIARRGTGPSTEEELELGGAAVHRLAAHDTPALLEEIARLRALAGDFELAGKGEKFYLHPRCHIRWRTWSFAEKDGRWIVMECGECRTRVARLELARPLSVGGCEHPQHGTSENGSSVAPAEPKP